MTKAYDLPPTPDDFPCRNPSCGAKFRPTRHMWKEFCLGRRPGGLCCSKGCANEIKRKDPEEVAAKRRARRASPEYKAKRRAYLGEYNAKQKAAKVKPEKVVAEGSDKPLNPPRICRGLPNWLGPKTACGALAAEGSARCENCNREMARRRKAAEEV